MPRGRSKSRTPSKKEGTQSHVSNESLNKVTKNKQDDDTTRESSLNASTLKRRRAGLNSSAKESVSNQSLPNRSSPRRGRTSSPSDAPPTKTHEKGHDEEDVAQKIYAAAEKVTMGLSNTSLKTEKVPKSLETRHDRTAQKSEQGAMNSTPRKPKAPISPPKSSSSSNSKKEREDIALRGPKAVAERELIPYPPSTTLDVAVHRVRHLDFIPSPVLAMASSSTLDDKSSLVAISRNDGSLELMETTFIQDYAASSSSGKTKWSPHLFPLATIAGSKRAVAHSLVFVGAVGDGSAVYSTLLAASPDGTLWTVQFAGQLRQLQSRIASGGGGVFDLTTCRQDSSELSSLVAGACQDGSIRIWQLRKNQESGVVTIQEPPIATLSTAGAPVLSVAWRCEKQVGGVFHTLIFAGVADGTIRKYVVQLQKSSVDGSIQCLKHKSDLRMTVESRGRKTPTKIWTMQALNDGSLVTGNSLGQIQIFDTITGTLLQSVNQTELNADVLRVAVNASQTKIFASGVDSRVVCLERSMSASSLSTPTSSSGSTWKFTTAQRPHTHDVKSMTIIQGKAHNAGTRMEALVTGGVDTKLCTYLVSDFAKKRPQVYYPWPSQSPVSSTTIGTDNGGGRRILSIHRDNQIELYRLDNEAQAMKRQLKDTPMSTTELIGEIAMETQSNLALSALCPNGKWLAAANATKLFLFRLNTESKSLAKNDGKNDDQIDVDIQPEKICLPRPLDQLTVTAIHFGGQNTLYVADSSRRLFVVDVSSDPAKIVSTLQIGTGGEDSKLPICSIKASPDDTSVVVMTKAEKNGGIQVFRRQEGEIHGYAHYWTIPDLPGARPAAVAMVGKSHLAVATVSFQIYVFDLERKSLTPWSETNKFPIEKWPTEISHRKDFPVRLFVNPSDDSQLIMSSFGIMVVVSLTGPLPDHCRMIPESHVRTKRKRNEEGLAMMVNRENPIVFAPPPRPGLTNSNSNTHKTNSDPNARNCTVCLNYNSMMHLDFLAPNEMVVVEQPWLRVIATFPEALQRRVYGYN